MRQRRGIVVLHNAGVHGVATKDIAMKNRRDSQLPCNTLLYGSLFAGIGGFDVGFDKAGLKCAWQVEINESARRVLEKNWPDVERWDDVRTWPQPTTQKVDVLCGGFPCQGISVAGTRAGLDDERSGLWHEFDRIIGVLRPRFVVIENSSEIVNSGLSRVLRDLASRGYDAEWQCIRASDFVLPHRRERAFIVAHANEVIGGKGLGDFGDGSQEVFAKRYRQRDAVHVQAAPDADRVADGVSGRAYRSRVEGLGNAIVPAIAEWIGRRLMESV